MTRSTQMVPRRYDNLPRWGNSSEVAQRQYESRSTKSAGMATFSSMTTRKPRSADGAGAGDAPREDAVDISASKECASPEKGSSPERSLSLVLSHQFLECFNVA